MIRKLATWLGYKDSEKSADVTNLEASLRRRRSHTMGSKSSTDSQLSFPTDGIDVKSIRELKGDSWMDSAYKKYKKILMEEIK